MTDNIRPKQGGLILELNVATPARRGTFAGNNKSNLQHLVKFPPGWKRSALPCRDTLAGHKVAELLRGLQDHRERKAW